MQRQEVREEAGMISAAENRKNTQNAIDNWMLGPDKPSNRPTDNRDYWREMAAAWLLSEKEARRQLCANCEYYDNTPETKAEMEAIPFNAFDAGAGFRGYCTKLKFICHDLRSCLAWEQKDFEEDEEMDDESED
jgi:hypothetical protein